MEPYTILPKFLSDDDLAADGNGGASVNGWNAHLETWLVEVQADCHTHYLMLIETAAFLVVAKWVTLIVLVWGLSATAVVVTGVALGTDPAGTGIWLPIFNACATAVTATVFTIYEAMDVNTWIADCRSNAGQFITIGRGIETLKRVPRAERVANGIELTRNVGEKFEELRAAMPSIVWHVRRRHTLAGHPQAANAPGATSGTVGAQGNDKIVSLHVTQVRARKESGYGGQDGSDEEGAEMTPSLQELFAARLAKQEAEQVERDELAQYEAYVRSHCGPP